MVSWSELYITVHKALNTTVKLLPFLSFAKKDPPLQLINLIHPTSISLSIFFFFYSSAHVPKLSLFTACSTINVQLRADVLYYSIRVASMPPAHVWAFISGLLMG